jgi:hypothetical protein
MTVPTVKGHSTAFGPFWGPGKDVRQSGGGIGASLDVFGTENRS